MNLIRNTLFTVLIVLLIGVSYMKFFEERVVTTHNLDKISTNNRVIYHIDKPLPISTAYTDYQQKPTVKIVKEITPIKVEKKIKITKVVEPKKLKKILIATEETKENIKPIVKVYKKIEKKIRLSLLIEKYAKKMLGKKYVWGATGPNCYDCSGFTQKVFRKVAGVKLPRVSYLQAKVGKKISFEKLKQGDMVFFDTEKKRTGRVNHVGIYLKNGNFIHASSGGKKVIITNFRKKRFYKNRFLWGRRVIKDSPQIAININGSKIN